MSTIVGDIMLKTLSLFLFIWYLTISSLLAQQEREPLPFDFGEELHFEVSYGWLNLADAKLVIHKRPQKINEREHFKIDIYGKTKGAATLFGKVNDNWGTILDKENILPSQSYRHIEEGNYRKHEVVNFDQKNKAAEVTLFDKANKNIKDVKTIDLPNQVQDIVSGFYFLRTKNLENLSEGDSIQIRGFFDEEIYNINLIYEGIQQIETVLGIQSTYVFSPKIPKNKLFRGDYPIKVWVSRDMNKIPLKIKANLFLGSLNLDLVSAKGIKNDPLTSN